MRDLWSYAGPQVLIRRGQVQEGREGLNDSRPGDWLLTGASNASGAVYLKDIPTRLPTQLQSRKRELRPHRRKRADAATP